MHLNDIISCFIIDLYIYLSKIKLLKALPTSDFFFLITSHLCWCDNKPTTNMMSMSYDWIWHNKNNTGKMVTRWENVISNYLIQQWLFPLNAWNTRIGTHFEYNYILICDGSRTLWHIQISIWLKFSLEEGHLSEKTSGSKVIAIVRFSEQKRTKEMHYIFWLKLTINALEFRLIPLDRNTY